MYSIFFPKTHFTFTLLCCIAVSACGNKGKNDEGSNKSLEINVSKKKRRRRKKENIIQTNSEITLNDLDRKYPKGLEIPVDEEGNLPIHQEAKNNNFKESDESNSVDIIEAPDTSTYERSTHTRSPLDWKMYKKVPSEILSEKSLKEKITLTAVLYKRLCYDELERELFCGGWYVLSHHNYLNNGCTKIASPEEMGLRFISAKNNWNEYKDNIIRYMRDGDLKVTACTAEMGSMKVKLTVTNTRNYKIKFNLKKGQVFEQTKLGIGKAPNVIIWDYLKKDNKNPIYTNFEESEKLVFEIPKNKSVTIILDSKCLNRPLRGPLGGKKLHLTDLFCKAALEAKGVQVEIWDIQRHYTKKEHEERMQNLGKDKDTLEN